MSFLTPYQPLMCSSTNSPFQRRRKTVSLSRLTSEHIMRGEDDRIVIFAGPCSIHDPEIALEYATFLKELSEKVDERIFIIMRVFLKSLAPSLGGKDFSMIPFLTEAMKLKRDSTVLGSSS